MVSVKEAVANAVDFANSVLDQGRTADLRLEELESGQSNGDDVWFVTLSMRQPLVGMGIGATLGGAIGARDYKIFTIHKETGEVVAMKIRELASA